MGATVEAGSDGSLNDEVDEALDRLAERGRRFVRSREIANEMDVKQSQPNLSVIGREMAKICEQRDDLSLYRKTSKNKLWQFEDNDGEVVEGGGDADAE